MSRRRLGRRPVGLGQARTPTSWPSELGIPAPRTWYPADARASWTQIDVRAAVRRSSRRSRSTSSTRPRRRRGAPTPASELRTAASRGRGVAGQGEMMVQELIPGDGRQQFAYCAFFKDGAAVAQHGRPAPAPAPAGLRPRQHVRRDRRRCPRSRSSRSGSCATIDYYGLVELEYKLDPRDGRVQAARRQRRAPGATTRLGPAAGVDFPLPALPPTSSGSRSRRCRARPGSAGSGCSPTCPPASLEIRAGDLHCREYLRSLRSSTREAVFSRDDPLPGLAEVALMPYLAVKRGF